MSDEIKVIKENGEIITYETNSDSEEIIESITVDTNVIQEESADNKLNEDTITNNTDSNAPNNTIEQILKDFVLFDETNMAISGMISSPTTLGNIQLSPNNGGINAVFNFANNLDNFGKAIKYGSPCPICGKNMKYIPPSGYCSIKCMMKDIQNRVMNRPHNRENDMDKITTMLQGALNALTLVFNMVAEFPKKLMDIAKLPVEYKNFLQIRINILFLTVKLNINKIMVMKNNIILNLLNPAKSGIYSDKVAGYFATTTALIQTAQQIYMVADTLYQTILKILQNPVFSIPPESYVWFLTPRSIAYYPSNLYVEVPVNMSTNPMNGIMSNIDMEKITKTFQNIFPPILAPEYLMNPKLFKYRLAMSPQSPIVQKLAETISQFLKTGPEYLPKYKDLKLTNIFFIWAILVGWAPRAKEFYGSFISPYM